MAIISLATQNKCVKKYYLIIQPDKRLNVVERSVVTTYVITDKRKPHFSYSQTVVKQNTGYLGCSLNSFKFIYVIILLIKRCIGYNVPIPCCDGIILNRIKQVKEIEGLMDDIELYLIMVVPLLQKWLEGWKSVNNFRKQVIAT